MTSNANKVVLVKTDLPHNERGRWVGALALRRLVPVGVGARYEHPRMADGENVYLVADDFVHDAIGATEGLAKRGRLVVMAFTGEDFKGIIDDSKDDAVGLVDANTPPSVIVGVRSCCDRHPCRGRGVPARGCWIHRRTDRQELQRAVCRVGRTAERKP